MRITLHIGAHYTGTTRLVNALKLNGRAFGRLNLLAPGPKSYRPKIAAFLQDLDGLPPIAKEEQALLADLLDGADPDHLMMVNESWAAPQGLMLQGDRLYDNIAASVLQITELFSRHEVRLSMAIRNPAFLLNAAWTSAQPPKTVKWFVKQGDPTTLSWVDPIERLQSALPDVPILMWCEEDVPLIWPRVIRAFAGVSPDAAIRGELAAVSDTLSDEGKKRFQAFVRIHDVKAPEKYERTVLAFLDKYAKDGVMRAECTVPGWDAHMVQRLSRNYESDITALARREGITFILPETQGDQFAEVETDI